MAGRGRGLASLQELYHPIPIEPDGAETQMLVSITMRMA